MQAVLADADVVNPARDRELALRRLGHAFLVYRERHQDRAVLDGQRDDLVDPLATVFEIHRIDDRAAGTVLERGPDDAGFRRVDGEWRRDTLRRSLTSAPIWSPRPAAR